MAIFDNRQLRVIALQNQAVPDQIIGVWIQLDFTANSSYDIDFSQYEWVGKINFIQTLFIDLSKSGVALDILEKNTQHDIVANAHTQGYYNFLSQAPTQVTVSCPGGPAGVNLFFLNTPIPGAVWAANHP